MVISNHLLTPTVFCNSTIICLFYQLWKFIGKPITNIARYILSTILFKLIKRFISFHLNHINQLMFDCVTSLSTKIFLIYFKFIQEIKELFTDCWCTSTTNIWLYVSYFSWVICFKCTQIQHLTTQTLIFSQTVFLISPWVWILIKTKSECLPRMYHLRLNIFYSQLYIFI